MSSRICVEACLLLLLIALLPATLAAQSVLPGGTPIGPPPVRLNASPASSATPSDSSLLPFPVKPIFPSSYEDLVAPPYPADLSDPRNVRTEIVYDPSIGCYVVSSKLGETTVSTPFILTPAQYNAWQTRQSMARYYHQRNSAHLTGGPEGQREPFNVLDMSFALGPLEKIFGPGGLALRTQGSVQIDMGIKSNFTDNPALSLTSRRKTFFDFDQKIQATVQASVGDRLSFNMNYNTDATFAFDSKNIKLQYEGKEDDIVKSIEAGNVSLTTGSSLIRGSTALFGIKSKLQFGKLTATALVSQQNSVSRSVSTKRGAQTTDFSVQADDYQANAHFFLSQYFRDHYDEFASKLPYVSSGIQITRIEVWVTNKNSTYNQSRNLVAFMDLGEESHLASDHWIPNPAYPNPSNQSNNLLQEIKSDYPGARDINTVTQALQPLSAFGIMGGRAFEKVESARLLSANEYTLNSTLGYISLRSRLNADQVLAVAYEYTYRGQVYQVGEFSADITTTDQSLYVKMLKSTTQDPREPMWRLMMKNVYSLGASDIQRQNFRLNIKYLSDTTGTEINYLPVPGLNDKSLLQVMNLDRLDSNQESNSDGFFDYIEGYTINPERGLIYFPVAEPFGSHLAKAIGNPVIAEQYAYTELYDSTLTVARQYADKNKFMLSGEYQASSGSRISLGAYNVPRGSVVVMAGGVRLTENSDYTVDYAMGTVTITNQSIIDSGQSISVTLEDQSNLFATQRKNLLGLDLNYAFNKNFNIGATVLHYGEKALIEKVNIGDETVNNTMLGLNFAYSTQFMWLTNLLNRIPTVNATAPSRLSLQGEVAKLFPAAQKSGSNKGSSYIDDFESAQRGLDLRSPYTWFLASTPYDPSADALFPEAALSNDVAYGKNRALLNWYYIDRLFTSRNSSLAPGYIKSDLKQLSNPYVREIKSYEIFPGRELSYDESNLIQTLNLSLYPNERGPYNLDATDIDENGNLLHPERRWGGIMRRLDVTDFESTNIEYIQFWLMNPFLDPDNPNEDGGDLYINLGELSEDILKDGLKVYENGNPVDGNNQFMKETVWGRVSTQNSLTYAFDNATSARLIQDTGLDGLLNPDEFNFPSYSNYVGQLRNRLSPQTIARMEADPFSPLNDPAGDNYHFYRGYDYDEMHLSILERYKRYNGVEGNSLSPEDAGEPLYQSSRALPDVEDINQDNTLNEYERYFQYRISLRPEDLEVGRNYITDKQTSVVYTPDGSNPEVEWYQFKIPLSDFQKAVGSINDFSTIRFMRMFMTGFKATTHLRFATLELVEGDWRTYDFNLNSRGDTPAEGQLDISVVNIEENAQRQPVNYILPPGVSRISDPSQSQIIQENEQSMSMKVIGLRPGDARAVYRNTRQDLRNYRRLQMWTHAEALIDNTTMLRSDDLSLFIRLGSDVKSNFYEYEIPLKLTPPGRYDSESEREIVWPLDNFLDLDLQRLVDLKVERNRARRADEPGVGYGILFTGRDPDHERNTMAVMGNPTLGDIRVMMIGIRNNSSTIKDGTVWVNELKVTDFDSEGGWAAKGTANLAVSDIATLNLGAHYESTGFGNVDQSLNQRRMDDYARYDVAVQADLGRFAPPAAKLRAPVFFSYSREKTTPKYNPLDTDVRLRDALDAAGSRHERDSISAFAVEQTSSRNFSISGLRSDVRSKNPMPWDPANFTISFSASKQSKVNPTTEYENTNDYRGSFQYSYNPYFKPLKPFAFIKSASKNLKFIHDWELNWLPTSITFNTNMSRYYYEQQTRSEVDQMFQLPVAVSKNFLWDRQLNLTWALTKTLNLSFASNTSARIEEPAGAVNRRLFPDKYREWKDTVMQSILHLGTPWAYNQTATATYTAPFSKIPALDFLSGTMNYNSSYRWDRGATVEGVNLGNTISNQTTYGADGRLNFENIYSKIPYLKEVTSRFNPNRRQQTRARKARRFERNIELRPDSSTLVRHNLRTRKLKIVATDINDPDGKPVRLRTRIVDNNNLELLDTGSRTLKLTITEVMKEQRTLLGNIGQYAARVAMAPRSLAVRFRSTRSLSLPLFIPSIGDAFGQTAAYGPMAPGLGFAFGFYGDDYVDRAKERGWLMTDDGQTSPANFSRTNELNLELNLEPLPGLKIQLTSNRTDSRTRQVQFMYADMPTSYAGSFTMTGVAIATALRSSGPDNGYESQAFNRFIENIPVVAARIESRYAGATYPSGGFMADNIHAGKPYDPAVGTVSTTGSDVLIPAFMAAYTSRNPNKQFLNPFPSLSAVRPNWRVTYEGLVNLGRLKDIFKSFTLSHAYQCTYTVGSYSSYLNWVAIDGSSDLGFTLDELSGQPIPSSPFNISSVAINERFAPLIGAAATLKNNLTVNAEWREQRTLTLNTSAGQVVEATTRGITMGLGYKIIGFNSVLRMRGSQTGVSHDLNITGDFSFAQNQALIRRIETAYTQATSGTRTISFNLAAKYQMSRRLNIGTYLEHQINTPIVSSTAYPTSSTAFGFSFNLSLAR